MTVSVQIEHLGVTYSAEVMTIKKTNLGYEDHGLLTASLVLEGNGTGVVFGGYALDSKPAERGADRGGTAYGLDHIIQIMRTVGVSSWEALTCQKVFALYLGGNGHWGQQIEGIANINSGAAFIPKEHAKAWLEAAS